jgi:hypothetical protein
MGLFKKSAATAGPAAAPAAATGASAPETAGGGADLREQIGRMSAAIDVFVTGDFRDSDQTSAIIAGLGASTAPSHFPDQSIWARSVSFADRAAAIGEWLIIVKLYQLCAYWNDDALPQLRQVNPEFCEMLGWVRAGDRAALRDKAFDAAARLPASLLVFPSSSRETVGEILWTESIALERPADWLARIEPWPTASVPTARESVDAILGRARQGDSDAVLYEKALSAPTDAEALLYLEQAAMLGSVEAMEAAAEMCAAAGNVPAEQYWAEQGANAGSVKAMTRLAAICSGAGRDDEAITWTERAGEAGHPGALDVLAAMASNDADNPAAERWADIGARRGHPVCMRVKGALLLNRASQSLGGPPTEFLSRAAAAHTLFVEAARRGSDRAMVQAGMLAEMFGPERQAAYWFTKAARLGNSEALRRLGQRG